MTLQAADEPLGTVRLVHGDLVYVEGLNGRAPLWTRLSAGGVSLEVIKELDNQLVARVADEESLSIRSGDVVQVTGDAVDGERNQARRKAVAVRVAQGPRVDGRLDDVVWRSAPVIGGFVQRDPDYWMPASEATAVRVLYDDEKIYFGFDCRTRSDVGLVANNMRRDSEIWGDDNIQILLDTYNDRQNGYFFFVNPLGAQRDLMLSNGGRTTNSDWDCNWTCRTRQTKEGWTAEVAIPFHQLRFRPSDEMVWGVNFGRYIAGKNESSQFIVGQRISSGSARYRTADIGELVGLEGLQSGRPLFLKPYVLPGTLHDFEASDPREDPTFAAGIDLRYGITPNLSLDVSYNTDFAQVEGDQEQVNLTQFRLFFPEKREFFLEGANLFDFGEASERRGGRGRPPTLLFYSRRIGLEEGGRIPIILGTKLAGKEGRTSLGLLNVLTDDGLVLDDDEDTIRVNRANTTVLRVRRDFLGRSNAGVMFVNKQSQDPALGWSTYNRAGGIDVNLSPSEALTFQAFIARTWDSEIGDADDARFFSADYQGGFLSTRFRLLDVEEQFEPAVGFVNRRSELDGFRRYDGNFRVRPRPGRWGVRYFSIGPQLELLTDRNNDVQYWRSVFTAWAIYDSGDSFRIEGRRTHDVVVEAFSPSDRREEVVIPPGSYTFTSFRTGPRMSRSRKMRPGLTLEAGTYYTGHRYTLSVDNEYRPTGRLSLETEYDGNWLRLPQGNLSIQTFSARAVYSFTTNFFVKLFVQWNNDRQTASANLLLNYRFRPGSDLFIVFDNGYGTDGGLTQRNRSALAKVSYQIGL